MQGQLEIKRIDLWTLFKVAFFLYAAIGLIMGLIYGFLLMIASLLQLALLEEEFGNFGILGGVLGLILIPFLAVLYGAMGSVFVTIGGWIYNLVAGFAGGIRFEARAVDAGTMAAAPAAAETTPPSISDEPPPVPPVGDSPVST